MSLLLWSGCILSCALDGVVRAWSIGDGAQLSPAAQFPPQAELEQPQGGGRGRGRGAAAEPETYRKGAVRMCGTVNAAGDALLVVGACPRHCTCSGALFLSPSLPPALLFSASPHKRPG